MPTTLVVGVVTVFVETVHIDDIALPCPGPEVGDPLVVLQVGDTEYHDMGMKETVFLKFIRGNIG